MIAVTIVAGRRGNVLPLVQRPRVYACLVVRVLIRWNLIASHVIGVRVALGAGLCDISCIDRRERIADGANVMRAVATDTGCDPLVSALEQPAMHACEILLLLVNAQRRVEFFHQVSVAMTLPAKSRNLSGLRSGYVAFSGIH